MVTIKDVAAEASTSIGTVSKALNGSHTISDEKTKQIIEVADRLGYRPNTRAQSLARKSTRSISFLASLDKNTAFENPHMFEMLSGAEYALSEKKYKVVLQRCCPKTACQMSKDIMAGKASDGLLIHASVVTKELAQMLAQDEIPHMIIGKPNFTNSLCWIDNDNIYSGRIAARRVKDLGHTNIALVGSHENDWISEDRLTGFQAEFDKPESVQVFRGEATVGEGERIGYEINSLPMKSTAVVCANNHLAVGCLRAFKKKGINVPDDISLITFDEYPFAKFTEPPLTTISIDVYDLGVQAGKLLVNKIRKPSLHVQSYSTLPVLIVQQSDCFAK